MMNGRGKVALRVLTIGIGVFFLGMGLNKLAWIGDPDLLGQRFERFLPNASPYAKVYLEWIAMPGAAVFARLVPVGELLTAAAMFTGVWVRPAAALALFMIANFHLATSSYSSWDFLRDGTGPPLFAALLALAIDGCALPWSLRRRHRRTQGAGAILLFIIAAAPAAVGAQGGVGEAHLLVRDETGVPLVASGIVESGSVNVRRPFETVADGSAVL